MNFSIRQRWVLVTVLGLMLSLAFGVAVGLLDSKSVRAQDLACQFPAGSNPTSEPDLDRDGLSDTIERSRFPLDYLRNQYDQATRVSTKIDNPDTDGDGLCDGEEFHGFKVVTSRLGQDGKPIELTRRTNPDNEDTDGDGFSDGTERDKGTDPRDLDDFPPEDPSPTSTPGPTPTATPTPMPSPTPTPTSTPTPTPTPTPDPAPEPLPFLPLDSDDDGISDAEEVSGWPLTVTFMGSDPVTRTVYSDPNNPDTDWDGRRDGVEKKQGTDPSLADSDGDGLTDAVEFQGFQNDRGVTRYTNPANADTDADGLSDGLESVLETDPMNPDSDQDGLTDWSEVTGKVVTNGVVTDVMRSNPLSKDSDDDGLSDSEEIKGFEMTIGDDKVTVTTNPLSGDTDADGLSDADERNGAIISVNGGDDVRVFSNPSVKDTDGDNLSDRDEVQGYVVLVAGVERSVRSNPGLKDTDGDSKSDYQEIVGWSMTPANDAPTFRTDPTLADTDGDGKDDASPEGGVTDENPEEADRGIAGLFLGPLQASGIPHSIVGLLIILAGAGTFLFAKLREDTTGDSSQRRLRDQGRELDESRRSYNDLQRESAREIGQLRSDVDDRDRRLRQLESEFQTDS